LRDAERGLPAAVDLVERVDGVGAQGDGVRFARKNRDFVRDQRAFRIEGRCVSDHEDVAVEELDFRALVPEQGVFDRDRMDVELALEEGQIGRRRLGDVEPHEAVALRKHVADRIQVVECCRRGAAIVHRAPDRPVTAIARHVDQRLAHGAHVRHARVRHLRPSREPLARCRGCSR